VAFLFENEADTRRPKSFNEKSILKGETLSLTGFYLSPNWNPFSSFRLNVNSMSIGKCQIPL